MKNLTYLILVLCITATFLTSCASPYQGQADALNAAYQAGQISANDYNARMAELQRLDFDRRQAIARGFQQGFQNLSQQQQAQQQLEQQQNLIHQQRWDQNQQEWQQKQPKTYQIRDENGDTKTITVTPQ